MVRRHKTVIALLLIGLVQAAAYFCAFRTDRPGWGLELGSMDKGCYLQTAANILEGHPFVFSKGDKPSTGTTSILYPYVLALPMAMGFTGDTVHKASFAIAVILYLTFLYGWGRVAEKKLPLGFAQAAAVAGIGLSGHCAYTAFMQTDQVLWLAVSALVCSQLCDWDTAPRTCRHRLPAILLLALGPWVRPEGTMLIIAFYLYLIFTFILPKRQTSNVKRQTLNSQSSTHSFSDFSIPKLFNFLTLIPLLSVLALYLMNYLVTGVFTATSMAGKGYFNLTFPSLAIKCTIRDVIGILVPYLLSIPLECRRFFSMPSPVLAVFFLVGAVAAFRRFRPSWPGWIFVLAAGAEVFAVGSSTYSGLDYDRYLAWLMPFPALIAAYGLHHVVASFCARYPLSSIHYPLSSIHYPLPSILSKLSIVALVAGMLFPTVSMVLMSNEQVHWYGDRLAECRRYSAALPPDSLTGTVHFLAAYQLPRNRAVRDIGGIYSPDYVHGITWANSTERMKHRPDLRVSHWLTWPIIDAVGIDRPEVQDIVFGPALDPADTNGYIRVADYSTFDRAVKCPIAGEVLDYLDVCYLPHETAAEYTTEVPVERNLVSFGCYADGIFDCGRNVTGGVSFRLACGEVARLSREGADCLRLVLRTVGSIEIRSETDKETRYFYPNPLKIALEVDGQPVAADNLELSPDGSFTDHVFDVPVRFIENSRPKFTLRGDFAIFAVWLVEPAECRRPASGEKIAH